MLFRAVRPERKLKIHLCWGRAELEKWAITTDQTLMPLDCRRGKKLG